MAGSVIDVISLGQAGKAKESGAQRGAIAIQQGLDEAKEIYKPYSEAGLRGLESYEQFIQATPEDIVAGIEDDPFYQFQLQQGLGAVEGSAAVRGNLRSGATLKDLTEYSQGLASQQIDKAFDRRAQRRNELLSLLDVGTMSAANLANVAVGGGQAMAGQHQALADAKAEQRTGYGGIAKGLLGNAGDAFARAKTADPSKGIAVGDIVGGGLKTFLTGGAI